MKSLLLKCDFIGFIPQFRILDEFRYKSVFSSLLSILIIFLAIIFVSISFIDFIHQKPNVEYYKNNDDKTNKTFLISDSLLMFNSYFVCLSNFSLEYEINIHLISLVPKLYEELKFEPCVLGKNINLKYKDLIQKFNSIEGSDISEYFCINYNNINFTLYSHPLQSYNIESELKIRIYSECEDYFLSFNLVTQNDLIAHNKKDNPIIPYYKRNLYDLNKDKKDF